MIIVFKTRTVLKIICENFAEAVVSLMFFPAFVFSFFVLIFSIHLLQIRDQLSSPAKSFQQSRKVFVRPLQLNLTQNVACSIYKLIEIVKSKDILSTSKLEIQLSFKDIAPTSTFNCYVFSYIRYCNYHATNLLLQLPTPSSRAERFVGIP